MNAIPRVLALLAAIGMIAGAIVIRNRMNDDEALRDDPLRLVCATELEEVCRGLDGDVDVTIEDAGTTLDRMIEDGARNLDGWLTPGPFPQMVQEVRRSQGASRAFSDVSAPLARSPVVVAAWRERAGPLTPHCPKRVPDVHCLGLAAGRPWTQFDGQPTWGEVKISLPDPATTAAGLVALGAGTAALFGRTDVSSDELRDNDAFAVWLNGLADGTRPVELSAMLAAGPSLLDALATIDVAAAPSVRSSAIERRVGLLYGDPVRTADVVLGTTAGARGRELGRLLATERVRQRFFDAGWKVTRGPEASGQDLPASSGLPSPGLLYVLRGTWEEAAR